MIEPVKIARRKGHPDESIEFRGVADTRRCSHCYMNRRHSVDAHASAIRFYEDDGTPL